MQANHTKRQVHYASIPKPSNGVLVLSGYGMSANVKHCQLVLSDGIGQDRREGIFSKPTSGIKHLVIIGHTGTISFEALHWLHDIGATISQIDGDGEVILASSPITADNPHLRQAQVTATQNGNGLGIVQELINRKIGGQAGVLTSMGKSEAASCLNEYASAVFEAEDLNVLRVIESQAAGRYWQEWASVPMNFAKQDKPKLPPHWLNFGARVSPLTHSPRNAANPANALLNYLYAVLETQVRIALLAVGLDPCLGLFHANQVNRDSLACDVMEVVRPNVDAWLFKLLPGRTFSRKEFVELKTGAVRVTAQLTPELAKTAALWASLAAPVAEFVAQRLLDTSGKKLRLPTNLSQSNRSRGRDGIRQRERSTQAEIKPDLQNLCKSCGTRIEAERTYCDSCLPAERAEKAGSFVNKGPEKLAKLRAEGKDPAHGNEAGEKRGATNAAHQRAMMEWESAHTGVAGLDSATAILPALESVPLSKIMAATGLSLRYCSLIRRGLRIPHPRHYGALRDLIESV